jgi:hypothetical protein
MITVITPCFIGDASAVPISAMFILLTLQVATRIFAPAVQNIFGPLSLRCSAARGLADAFREERADLEAVSVQAIDTSSPSQTSSSALSSGATGIRNRGTSAPHSKDQPSICVRSTLSANNAPKPSERSMSIARSEIISQPSSTQSRPSESPLSAKIRAVSD